jgi:excisionase family DNA binding protein
MTTNPEDDLTLHEVAAHLGVHYMTAYRYVRLGMLPARRVGRSWRVSPMDLAAFGQTEGISTLRGEADWVDRLYRRSIAADEPGSWGVVEAALGSGMALPDAYADLISPVLERVGEAWESDEIDVATEHAASVIVTRIVGRLGPRLVRPGVRKGTVVLGSTATELHSLPIALAADLIREAQFEVIDLGALLPADSFARFVSEQDDLVVVGVGVTTPDQEEDIGRTLAALREVTTAPIIVGGAGVSEETTMRLGADAYARTAEEAVLAIEALLDG